MPIVTLVGVNPRSVVAVVLTALSGGVIPEVLEWTEQTRPVGPAVDGHPRPSPDGNEDPHPAWPGPGRGGRGRRCTQAGGQLGQGRMDIGDAGDMEDLQRDAERFEGGGVLGPVFFLV